MRRVCMLGTSSESKGGIGTVVRGFVNGVCPDGYEFEHIITHNDYGVASKLALAGGAYARCLISMGRERYALVHIHSAFGASFTRSIPFIRMASRRGLPIVNHLHADDWEAFYDNASADKRSLITETYGRCSRIIALSQEWAATLSTVVPEERIAVLENFTPIYEESFWPSRLNKTVIFMSRLEKIKGCDILPEICEAVVGRMPETIFLICGEGTMRDPIERDIRARGLENNVKLLGWVGKEQKAGVLKQGSLFLLPSYGEGMPMCVLEAMGLGLPIVATRVGGVPQIVEDGWNGFLLEPGNAQAVARAIVAVLEDEDRFISMSRESKAKAEQHSIQAYSRHLKVLYDEILQESA